MVEHTAENRGVAGSSPALAMSWFLALCWKFAVAVVTPAWLDPLSADMELLLIVLLLMMIPGLLSYLR